MVKDILWEKKAKQLNSEKALRLFVKNFLKEKLKGLPPDFRLGIKVLDPKKKKVAIKIPAHSEGNPIRIAQMDRLTEELEKMGLEVELFYLDDIWETDFTGGQK